MGRHEGEYGTVPRRRRPLFIAASAAVGVAVIVIGLIINAVADTPVRWPLLLVAAGCAIGFYAIYLWIRLSD